MTPAADNGCAADWPDSRSPEIALWHQVGRVREGRHPGLAVEAGVPAHVVDVQVGVDHHVDVLGLQTPAAARLSRNAGVQPVPHRDVRPLLVVADTGVDQDGAPFAAQHPGLDGRDAAGPCSGFQKSGSQPVLCWLPSRARCCREELCGAHLHGAVVLLDTGDGDVAQFDLIRVTPWSSAVLTRVCRRARWATTPRRSYPWQGVAGIPAAHGY